MESSVGRMSGVHIKASLTVLGRIFAGHRTRNGTRAASIEDQLCLPSMRSKKSFHDLR